MTELPIEQSETAGDDAPGGELSCFSAAVARYETPLLRYAGQMLHGDCEQAQDVVQEAFLRLHRRLDNNGMHTSPPNPATPAGTSPGGSSELRAASGAGLPSGRVAGELPRELPGPGELPGAGALPGANDLTGWLYRVVHNLVIDVLRRRKRHADAKLRLAEDAADAGPAGNDGLDGLIHREACARAMAELQNLPDSQRQVMLLKTIEGLTLRQISKITGLSVGNAGYHLRKGLAELARRLKQQKVI